MNFKKFIELAKENGISESELTYSKSSKLSMSLFHGELDNYTVSTTSSLVARGIYKGQMGFASSEKLDSTSFGDLVSQIKDSAAVLEKDEKPLMFKGSKRYHKKNVYSVALQNWDTNTKLDLLHKLEDTLKGLDPRVTEVQVQYTDVDSESAFVNSYGLNLKNKSNYFYFYADVLVKDGDDTKSYGDIFLDNDPAKFDLESFAKSIVEGAISLLHGAPVGKAHKTKVVFNQDTVSSLVNALLGNLSAEEVQKHTSLFEGKLNQDVLSKKITIEEKPLEKNCFFQYFDDEGVACVNKKVISRGKLLTYFYNLETAAKDGVDPTGNAARMGGKMGISFNNIVMKPGKLSEEELFAKVKDGVYITELNGLHAGLDATSGDFSLQSAGYLIKDGKKAGPLALFTIAGNLFKVFNDVIAVGNNSKLTLSSTNVPSIAVKNLKISG